METKDMKGRKGNTTNRSCSRFADKQKVKTQKNSEVLKVKTQKTLDHSGNTSMREASSIQLLAHVSSYVKRQRLEFFEPSLVCTLPTL